MDKRTIVILGVTGSVDTPEAPRLQTYQAMPTTTRRREATGRHESAISPSVGCHRVCRWQHDALGYVGGGHRIPAQPR